MWKQRIEHQATVTPALLRLPDRLRLGLVANPAELAADLARLDDADWTPHFVAQHYRGAWDILPLRFPAGANHPILRAVSHPGVTDWQESEALGRSPALCAVLESLPCAIGAARLMRLGPGSVILEHRDHDLEPACGTVRLHVPILTHSRARFWLNDVPVVMAPGELWYLRLADPHRAENCGSSSRVHLVIDATLGPRLAERLCAAADGE